MSTSAAVKSSSKSLSVMVFAGSIKSGISFSLTSRRGAAHGRRLEYFHYCSQHQVRSIESQWAVARTLISTMDFEQIFGNNFSILPGWRPVSKSIEKNKTITNLCIISIRKIWNYQIDYSQSWFLRWTIYCGTIDYDWIKMVILSFVLDLVDL